jgi:hypothetical protein
VEVQISAARSRLCASDCASGRRQRGKRRWRLRDSLRRAFEVGLRLGGSVDELGYLALGAAGPLRGLHHEEHVLLFCFLLLPWHGHSLSVAFDVPTVRIESAAM